MTTTMTIRLESAIKNRRLIACLRPQIAASPFLAAEAYREYVRLDTNGQMIKKYSHRPCGGRRGRFRKRCRRSRAFTDKWDGHAD